MNNEDDRYELSPEMEVATGSLYYGIVVDSGLDGNNDSRVVKDEQDVPLLCENGLPLTVSDLIGVYNAITHETDFDIVEPYTQSLYHSSDCVLNEMIRDLASSIGDRFINPQVIPYWRSVVLSLNFNELYSRYSNAMLLSRHSDHLDMFTNREFDNLRPRLRIVEDAESPGTTVQELLDTTDIYGSFRELTQHKIELYTCAGTDIEDTRKVNLKVTAIGKQVICRVCCDSFFVLVRTDEMFDFCATCLTQLKK